MVYRPGEPDGDVNAVTRATLRLLRGLRSLPADLAAVVATVVATNAVVLAPLVRETPLRVPLGLAFVLFVPGYAFVSALFPEAGPAASEASAETDAADGASASIAGGDRAGGIDGIERVALSFGLSIAITPLVGLVLNFTPWGIRLVPILASLSLFALLSTAVAAHRRWELPPDERLRVPYREWLAAGRAELLDPPTRTDAVLNVLVVVSVVLATTSVGYAVLVPQQGESFSELYLLTETDDGDLVTAETDEGELVADEYPTEFTVGEGRELVVGIGNHEHERTDYTVVSQLQRVRIANNSTTVLRSEELSTVETTLAHNETWHHRHTVTPTFEGTRLRLLYLLYRGSPPAEPTVENAYREVHLWVNVSSPAQ